MSIVEGAANRRRLTGPALLAFAISLAAALPAAAHETWLLPETFAPSAGEALQMRMTSGMGFPGMDSAIAPSRLREAVLLQNGERLNLTVAGTGSGALLLTTNPKESAACAAVKLRPRVLAIESKADVEHYLEEVGAPQSVWEAWEATAATETWRESYSKLARSFLRGTPADEPCWDAAGGTRFDIVPAEDPSVLGATDSLSLRLTLDGAPLAAQAVGIVREGNEPAPLSRSNADGHLELKLSGPGRYMVYATHLRPVDMDNANWESDFVTLTFEVVEE